MYVICIYDTLSVLLCINFKKFLFEREIITYSICQTIEVAKFTVSIHRFVPSSTGLLISYRKKLKEITSNCISLGYWVKEKERFIKYYCKCLIKIINNNMPITEGVWLINVSPDKDKQLQHI